MEQLNKTDDPESSNTRDHQTDQIPENDESNKETALRSVDLNIATCSLDPAKPFIIDSTHSVTESPENSNPSEQKILSICLQKPLTVTNGSSVTQVTTISSSPVTEQPQRVSLFLHALPSSQILSTLPDQPPSLFMQALSQLNPSSLSLSVLNNAQASLSRRNNQCRARNSDPKRPDDVIKTPDSLTSAPPSYSFVLRQTAARQRPRLMGTFIPSPSFVNHAPPPNYAAAFDIYVDNTLAPQQPIRVFDFGFTPIPALCQECGYSGLTVTVTKITMCTHCCAIFLCLFCCWICAPLPYLMRSCKDVRHYCRNCGHYLGMYSPAHPETHYPPR